MIVSFEFYVMNFVDFVVDCYSHITSHVSQAFSSCTHNTSYSLLNIVHIIVCVYGLTNQVWKILRVLCTTDLLLKKKKKKKGDCLKSKFLGELGFKSWVYENHIISYSCIFFHIFSSFEERLHQILLIFKNSFFLQFRSIESVFQLIEIAIKNFSESLSVLIDRNCFSINRISWIRFFKIQCLTRSEHFFKSFFNFSLSLSLRLGKAKSSNFCRFPPNLLQGFPFPKPVSPFYHSFCISFHVCMHKFMHLFEFLDYA